MSELVSPTDIERIVGRMRHATGHYARAVSDEGTVYVLHSQACLDSGIDLRECEYSIALDRGITRPTPWARWRRVQDRPVRVLIVKGWLLPDLMTLRGLTCPECHLAGEHKLGCGEALTWP